MKFPPLILKQFCKTPVSVTIYCEGLSEDGAPIIVASGDFFCNYQDKVKTVLSSQKKTVQANGTLLFAEDIAPDTPTISDGYVVINGIKREIACGVKALNPDGSVNFVELDVF